MKVTCYSVAEAGFFPGAVAMLNSLRLTGHDYEVVFMDAGLTDEQRRRLELHARIVATPKRLAAEPTIFKPAVHSLLKPAVHELHADGVAVLIDSDIVVTGSLESLVATAAEGKICLYRDHPLGLDRSFDEWRDLFELQAPLRPRIYVNAGFIAIGGDLAGRLLPRWWRATERLLDRPRSSGAHDPDWDSDQDALNALLMSEVDERSIVDLPDEMAIPPNIYRTRVVDSPSLRVELDGRSVRLLHYTGPLKPWDTRGWTRVRRDAYTRLLPRLFYADDVLLRLEPHELPLWLRPSPAGRAALRTVSIANRALRGLATRTPAGLEDRLRRIRVRLARS